MPARKRPRWRPRKAAARRPPRRRRRRPRTASEPGGNIWLGRAGARGRRLPATGPGHRDHQRAHFPDQRAGDRARHHRHSRQPHRGGRRNVAVPAGAQVIDAKGSEVYPGFIDARTSIGLNEPGPRGFDDTNEMLEINASVKAQVAYQSDSDAIPVARVNGITSVAVVPSGGLIGGQIAVMNLDGWTWEEATLQPVAGVSFQFPPLVARRRWRWRRRRQRRCQPQVRGSEEGARCASEARRGSDRAGARLRAAAGRRTRHRLEPRGARADRRSQAADVRAPPTTKPTFAKPSRLPIAPASASSSPAASSRRWWRRCSRRRTSR